MQPILPLFDRHLLRKRRQKIDLNSEAFSLMCREVSSRLITRLNTFKRNFSTCWQVGNDGGYLIKNLLKKPKLFVLSDLGCPFPYTDSMFKVVADEESFSASESSLDLILSFLNLNFINDIPGTLGQYVDSLTPDGLFMAVFIGGDSLYELRSVFQEVEIKRHQGISNRFMPLISTKDAGYLLGQAGFALPVADMDRIVIRYQSVAKLIQDLKMTGNGNVLANRNHPCLSKQFLRDVENLYQQKFSHHEGGIQATFEIIYMTGWRPGPNQQRPLKPGSAKQSLKDFLE